MQKQIEEYQELIKLTKIFISEEFKGSNLLEINHDNYHFFQTFEKNAQKAEPIVLKKQENNQLPSPLPLYPSNKLQKAPLQSPIIIKKEATKPTPSFEPQPQFVSDLKKEIHQFYYEDLKIKYESNFSLLKKEIQALFPNLEFSNELLSDNEAKKIATQWKKNLPEVIILSFNEPTDEIEFLQKVTLAISEKITMASHYSAHIIESQNKWQKMFQMKDLKLIIAPHYGVQTFKSLINFYNHTDKTLGGIPILLLPNLSLYLKQPELKRALWQAICAKLNYCP